MVVSALAVIVVIALVALAVWLVRTTTAVEVDDLDIDADGRVLVARWADRAHRWRRDAAVPAVVAAAAVSLRATDEVSFGLMNTAGVTPLWGDPVVAGLLALALGGLAAELHQLRPTRGGRRSAELRPRDLATLRRPSSRVRRAVLSGLVLVAIGWQVWLAPTPLSGGGPPAIAVAAVVLVAGEVTERRIAGRPRPALPAGLVRADDLIRRAAVRSVDDATSSAALMLLAWASLGLAGRAPEGALFDALTALVPITALVVAAVWAWRSRPSRLLAAAGEPVAP